MTFWLVGEAPNAATERRPDLWLLPDNTGYPHTANRLLEIAGWTIPQYLRVFAHRTNVWARPWSMWIEEGRRRARAIAAEAANSDGVIVLGARAATAFGLEGSPPFEWAGKYACVPHTSGACRVWNDPDVRARGRAFFANLLERATARAVKHG